MFSYKYDTIITRVYIYFTTFINEETRKIICRRDQHGPRVNIMLFRNITVRQKENLFHWEVTLKGPLGSPYEGYDLLIDFDFP